MSEDRSVSYTDTDGDTVRFVLNENGGLDYFENGEQVCDLKRLLSKGRTIHLEGTSAGSFASARETEVPEGKEHLVQEILALFREAQAADDEEVESSSSEEEEPQAAPTAGISMGQARAAAARDYANPMESLQALLQKSTRATSTKDNIVYTFEEVDKGSFVATVQLLAPGVDTSRSGEPQGNKQKAKNSASLAALRDPEVHRLLPPLPPKAQEPKATKAAGVQGNKEQSVEKVGLAFSPEPRGNKVSAAVSAKERQKQEKAAKAAKRKSAKEAKKSAFVALEDSEEEEASTEEKASEGEETSEEEEEETSSEEEEASSEGSDDEDAKARADLAAKKVAIKAKLRAAKQPAKCASASRQVARAEVTTDGLDEKKKLAEKAHRDEFLQNNVKVLDTKKQKNFGLTKFIKP